MRKMSCKPGFKDKGNRCLDFNMIYIWRAVQVWRSRVNGQLDRKSENAGRGQSPNGFMDPESGSGSCWAVSTEPGTPSVLERWAGGSS